jgi:O-antigen ligase
LHQLLSSTLTRLPAWKADALPLIIALLGTVLAASLFYTPILLILLLVIPSSLYFISRPYELLLVMVFLIPFNFVFTIGPVPVAVELLKVVAWVPFLVHLSNSHNRFRTSKYNKWFAIWAGILLLSVLRSNNLPLTIKESVRIGSNLGLCYLVVNLVDSREKMLQIFRVLTVSTFLVACYGFYQWAIQDFGGLFWIINPRVDTNLAPGRDVFWLWRSRIISTLTSEMELGHYFNLCLPVAVSLWLSEGRGRASSKWLLMAAAMLVGLLLTFTFASWLALAATTGLFVLLLDEKRRWQMAFGGMVVLSLVTLLVVFSPLREFLEAKALGAGNAGLAFDIMGRLDSSVFALQTWWSHPWLGVGIGSYQLLEYAHEYVHSTWVPSGSTPHEAYLYLLAVSGILGLAAMLTVLLGSIRTNLKLRTDPELGLFTVALAFAVATALFASFADDSPLFGPHAGYILWLLIGLGETAHNLVMVPTRVAT